MIKQLLFLLFSICMFSQVKEKYNISYNESINFGEINSDVTFDVKFNSKIERLNGNDMNSFVFEKPGEYIILVNEKILHKENECNHNHFPKTIKIIVSDVKMIFDVSNLQLVEPIFKNKPTDGNYVTVPVQIKTYTKKPIILDKTPVIVSGIGSEITATLIEDFHQVNEGNYTFKYKLSGKVTQNSYLMFDFIDANGVIQTASLTYPIPN